MTDFLGEQKIINWWLLSLEVRQFPHRF